MLCYCLRTSIIILSLVCNDIISGGSLSIFSVSKCKNRNLRSVCGVRCEALLFRYFNCNWAASLLAPKYSSAYLKSVWSSCSVHNSLTVSLSYTIVKYKHSRMHGIGRYLELVWRQHQKQPIQKCCTMDSYTRSLIKRHNLHSYIATVTRTLPLLCRHFDCVHRNFHVFSVLIFLIACWCCFFFSFFFFFQVFVEFVLVSNV